MTNNSLRFQKITLYLFSPYTTFVFLDTDKLRFNDYKSKRDEIIKEMNKENLEVGNNHLRIKWMEEFIDQPKRLDSLIPLSIIGGKNPQSSFIMGELDQRNIKDIEEEFREEFGEYFPENSLEFNGLIFYIQSSGVCQCSTEVKLKKQNGFNISELQKVSDKLHDFIKKSKCFRDICFNVALKYIEIIERLKIPTYQFELFPNLKEFNSQDKEKHAFPYVHRVYHIHDDSLFKIKEPISNFKSLLTPVSKKDIQDDSLYDNRYIYFGWSNSLILTSTQFSESDTKLENELVNYVHLIEVSSANFRSIEILTELIDHMIAWFNVKFKDLELEEIKQKIYSIRDFNVGVNRMLDAFSYIEKVGIVDTEKRALLLALNDRWNTTEMYNKLIERSKMLDSLLQDYYQRLKEKRDESLNIIVLLFTIMNLIEIFGTIFSILSTDIILSSIIQIIILITGTISIGLMIIIYLKLSGKWQK